MNVPNSETLAKLLADATPGEWRKVPADHTMRYDDDAAPFDVVGQNDEIIANNQAFYPVAVSPENASLIALAPSLAAEVLRLRAQLSTLTDPSPEAQLRRYRAAREMVDDPPRILLPWVEVNAGKWVRANLKGYVTERAETEERAEKDATLIADGWLLCGAK